MGSNIRTLAVLNVELKVVVLVNVVVYVAALVFVAFSDVLFGANLAVGIVSKGRRRARNCTNGDLLWLSRLMHPPKQQIILFMLM